MELHLTFALTLLLWLFIHIQDVLCVECYSCVYLLSAEDSQSSCSDPWPWYREAFGDVAKPPTRHCPHACLKIVISQNDKVTTVVRQCGRSCNETSTQTTTTSCCEEDFCNGGKIHQPGLWTVLSAVLAVLFLR